MINYYIVAYMSCLSFKNPVVTQFLCNYNFERRPKEFLKQTPQLPLFNGRNCFSFFSNT